MKKSNKKDQQQISPYSMRFTKEEREQLDKAAAGLSLSAFIRMRLLGDNVAPRKTRNKFPVKDHKILAQILGLLGKSRLASNFNQIAKSVHTGSLPVTPETEDELVKASKAVLDMRDLLLKALGLSKNGDK